MTRSLRLDDFLPFRLSVTSNAVSREIARAYESRFGLKVAEWRVLAVLAEGSGLTQRALVQRTEMDKMTVSRAAQALAIRRLIERAPSGSDRRSHLLALSAEGQRLYAEIVPIAKAMEARVIAGFHPDELHRLTDMLARLKAAADCGES